MMKARIVKYDFMRTLAVAGVILGHSLSLAADVTVHMVTIENYLTVLLRPVVPVFLFLAGVCYKPGQKPADLALRIGRILTPYLFFAAVFTFIYRADGVQYHPLNYLLRIVTCEIHPIYYYVFVMMECIVIMFLYERIASYDRMLIPFFAAACVISLLHGTYSKEVMERLHFGSNMVLFYTYRSPMLWFVFYSAGLVYRKYPVIEQVLLEHRLFVRGVWIGLLCFYWIMRFFGIGDLDFLNSVITTMICFAAVMALLTVEVKSDKWVVLSQKSYTIYLAHVPFYYMMARFWAVYPDTSQWLIIVLNAAVMSVGAALVYWAGKALLGKKSFYIIGS